jgi:hypothetical protein
MFKTKMGKRCIVVRIGDEIGSRPTIWSTCITMGHLPMGCLDAPDKGGIGRKPRWDRVYVCKWLF